MAAQAAQEQGRHKACPYHAAGGDMTDDGKVKEVPFAEHARTRREVVAEMAAVNWLLAHIAGELPPDSPTAMAIGRGASWVEIEALARWEGALEIVALLEDAARSLGPDLPATAAGHSLDRSTEASRLETNPIPLPAGKPRAPNGDGSDNPPGD